MYYLLNFEYHTFKTMYTSEEIISTLKAAKEAGQDLTYYEIVNCFNEEVRTCGDEFLEDAEEI